MQSLPSYEKQIPRYKQQRVWAYSLLWIFLGLFTYSLSHFTGRNYPMDTVLPLGLILIGLWKLYRIWYPKPPQASR